MIEFVICDDNKLITEKVANTISDVMMKNKLIAIILTLITVFSVVAVPAGAAAQANKKASVIIKHIFQMR